MALGTINGSTAKVIYHKTLPALVTRHSPRLQAMPCHAMPGLFFGTSSYSNRMQTASSVVPRQPCHRPGRCSCPLTSDDAGSDSTSRSSYRALARSVREYDTKDKPIFRPIFRPISFYRPALVTDQSWRTDGVSLWSGLHAWSPFREPDDAVMYVYTEYSVLRTDVSYIIDLCHFYTYTALTRVNTTDFPSRSLFLHG